MPEDAEAGAPSRESALRAVIGVAIVIGLAFAGSLWIIAVHGVKYSASMIILFITTGIFLMILLRYAIPRTASGTDAATLAEWKKILVRAARTGLIFIGLSAAFGGSLYLVSSPGKSEELLHFSYLAPIIFLFIAIGVFLVILLHYAVTLKDYGFSFEVTALGLPEGSIRAFIAIALIALVGVFGSFLFFETKGAQYRKVVEVKLVEADVTTYRAALPTGFILLPLEMPKAAPKPTNDSETAKKAAADAAAKAALEPRNYQVVFVESNAAQIDIAKQLLTMIVTVLTTVIGFYFGAKTAEQKTDADAAAKRNDALSTLRDTLSNYDDAKPKLDADLKKLEDAAIESIAAQEQARIKEAMVAIRKKLEDVPGRIEKARTTLNAASTDLKAALESRDDAANALKTVKDVAAKIGQVFSDQLLKSKTADERVVVLQNIAK